MRADAIGVARVPLRLQHRHGVRPALERWLAEAEVARLGLPPQAIVLVRQLRAGWAELASPDRASRYETLAAVLAGAGRPALGPATGDAVWFADEAELLACMARDALAGSLMQRWWWRVLSRDVSLPGARAQWLQAPQSVPRASQQLGAPLAVRWLASWTVPEQRDLLVRLSQVFPVAQQVRAYVEHGTLPPSPATVRLPVRRHWRTDSAAPDASPAARLKALCAALAQDASAAADGRQVSRFAAWCARSDREPAQEAAEAALPRRSTVRSALMEKDAANRSHAVRPAPARRIAEPARSEPTALEGAAPVADAAPAEPLVTASAEPAHDIALTTLPPPAQATLPSHASTLPAALDTRYGGVLFLLNAALLLGLYGDFTQPLKRSLPFSPWRFLLHAGRALGDRGFSRDPLADWLARHDTPPCIEMRWQLPPQWLEPFAACTGAWRAIWQDGLLSLHHPAGFAVLTAPALIECCEDLAASELTRLGVHAPRVQRVVVARRAAARRPRHDPFAPLWRYLRARLALALGLPTHPRSRLMHNLLRLPARVYDAGERVDVQLSLDALPLAVRLAGLDRDPGWVPAAGCDLRFHFH